MIPIAVGNWQLQIKKVTSHFFFDSMYQRALEMLLVLFYSIKTSAAALIRVFWQPSSLLSLWAVPRIFNKQ